jgi:hypothetical protein
MVYRNWNDKNVESGDRIKASEWVKHITDHESRLKNTDNLSDVTHAPTSFNNIKQDATTTTTGVVELATDGQSDADVVVQGNDARLVDARAPTIHETSHESGGGDEIDFDQLADGTTYKKFLATERTTLSGATLNADTDVSGNSWVVDEDNMASDLDTKVPTQQSVKAYVDSAVFVVGVKNACVVATDVALPANTAAGGPGVGKTLTMNAAAILAVDGVNTVITDRILVKDEGTGANNGIYDVTTEGTGGVAAVLTRATDFDEDADVFFGAFVFIESGTVNSDNGFTLTTADPITVDTTALVFTQTSGAGQIIAGSGMTKTANTLDVIGGTGITANANDIEHTAHTGDVTGATALTIATDTVTYDKMQDTSGTDKILGRSTAGAGTIEEIACTAAGRAILDDTDAAAQRTTLGSAASGSNSDITQLSGLTTDLSIAQGGTGQSTEQAAIDALSQVSAATNEYVFTKDTGTGNAKWKASVGGGGGDMLKSTYDPNADGVIALGQTEANYYVHPSARQCTTGSWEWGSITSKPSTFTPTAHDLDSHNSCTLAELSADLTDGNLIDTGDSRLSDARTPTAHNQSATTITSGTLPVGRGGTGVTGDTYDADKVDGCHAGWQTSTVYKIPGNEIGCVLQFSTSGLMSTVPSTDGYQYTTHSTGAAATWAASSDLLFSDTHCPKCGVEFQDGDNLILHVIGHNEVGDILTIPIHKDCAEAPKKTVTIRRKVMEDQYTLDELTGEPKVQRVQKMQKKIVTKHKMKEGYALDNKSGNALKIDKDGKRGETKYNLSDALEIVEEAVSEVVTEDVEFEL